MSPESSTDLRVMLPSQELSAKDTEGRMPMVLLVCFLETDLHHAEWPRSQGSTNLNTELTRVYNNTNFLQSEYMAIFVIVLFGFVVL